MPLLSFWVKHLIYTIKRAIINRAPCDVTGRGLNLLKRIIKTRN
jgi:hypothetical protein